MTSGQDKLADCLLDLPKLLEERQKALDEREAALKRDIEAFEKEQVTVAGNAKKAGSDVIALNVGGRNFDVLRRTLTSVPGSLLEARDDGTIVWRKIRTGDSFWKLIPIISRFSSTFSALVVGRMSLLPSSVRQVATSFFTTATTWTFSAWCNTMV